MADEMRSFAVMVSGLDDGALHAELTEKLEQVVAALREAKRNQGGKPKASLTLSLDFKLDGETTDVYADIKVAYPKRTRNRTILYINADNRLSQSNPRQQTLPFRDVNQTATVVDPSANTNVVG